MWLVVDIRIIMKGCMGREFSLEGLGGLDSLAWNFKMNRIIFTL